MARIHITQNDFRYLKDKLFDDRTFHDKEFLSRIDPDTLDAYFEGDPNKEYEGKGAKVNRISLSRLFPATSTLIPSLYPENPRFVGIPKRIPQDELGAKIAASAMNYYFAQMNAEAENQQAILSAWLYGFGVTKQGWRTEYRQDQAAQGAQKPQGFLSRMGRLFAGQGAQSVEEEKTQEYISSEGPFLYFVNPKNIYFDQDQPLGRGKFVHEHIKRTLREIRTSGLYQVDEDFYTRYRGTQDERKISLDIYESWNWQDDKLYLFVYCDGYDKPLRYQEMPYASEGFPYKTLTFVKEINRVYPVSHMKVAQRAQRLLDYILTLQKEAIEKYKDITVFDGDAFDRDDKDAIRANRIGTNVFTKSGRPPGVTHSTVAGANIPKELFAVSTILENNIKEILTIVGARQTGSSDVETLGQEKIADYGNQLRSMGLQDSIKSFLLAQGKKLLQDLKQFATAPAIIKITGLNLRNPETGALVTDEWVEFATERSPQTLREIIPADIDIDIDITQTMRRDMAVVRKQLMEFVQTVVLPLVPLLASEGKKFNAYEFIKKAGENFETLGNVEQFFIDIEPFIQEGLPVEGEAPLAPASSAGLSPEGIEQGITAPAGMNV